MPNSTILLTLIGGLWTVLIAIGTYILRTLREELRDQRVTTAEAAAALKASLDRSLEVQSNRWDQHENEHREFRRDMLAHESRLSRIEGQREPKSR